MRNLTSYAVGLLAAGTMLSVLSAQAVAQSNSYPPGSYSNVPSYAQPNNQETIKGRINAVNGTWNISVADDRGYIDNVNLHQGTIINPTGLTLEAGMRVSIIGHNAGKVFEADQIDAEDVGYGYPYNRSYYGYSYPYPYYSFGFGWWYPHFYGYWPYGYFPGYHYYYGGGFNSRGYRNHQPIIYPRNTFNAPRSNGSHFNAPHSNAPHSNAPPSGGHSGHR